MCTRCDDCVRGCADTHGGRPRFVREGDKYGGFLVARSCYHCEDPVCLVGCPTGAIRRANVGDVVEIEDSLCIGCGACAENCPYDAIVMHETGSKWSEYALPERIRGIDRLVASKCDLRYQAASTSTAIVPGRLVVLSVPATPLHVYGGALFLLLMLMHTAFSIPHGILTGWLWFLSMWLILGGFAGLVLQKWIPTLLATGLTTEVHLSRIPELIAEMRSRAETITQTGPEVLRDLYIQHLASHMSGPRPRWGYYFNVTSLIQSESEQFNLESEASAGRRRRGVARLVDCPRQPDKRRSCLHGSPRSLSVTRSPGRSADQPSMNPKTAILASAWVLNR